MNEKIQKTLATCEEILSAELFQILKEWYDFLTYERQSSLYTVYNYLLDTKDFLQFLQDYYSQKPGLETLVELDLTGFRSFLAQRVQNGKSASSNKRALSALRNLYQFIQKRLGRKSLYINEITSPKADKRLPSPIAYQQALEMNHLDALYTNKPQWVMLRDEALLILLYGCGLRISEALGLDIKDINQDELRIKGKRNKERIVPMIPLVYDKLSLYIEKRPGAPEMNDPLFIGVKGDRLIPRTVQKTMEKVRMAFGLPETATPHSLRHSYASHLLAGGADLRSIQELLGHDSLASTQVYTKIEDQSLIDIYMKTHPRAK